jgi:pentapeptide MXKDX repeat protein
VKKALSFLSVIYMCMSTTAAFADDMANDGMKKGDNMASDKKMMKHGKMKHGMKKSDALAKDDTMKKDDMSKDKK